MKRVVGALFIVMATAASIVSAGTYNGTLASYRHISDLAYVPPYAIVHPFGYTGSGGTITLNVCVVPGSEVMTETVDYAIAQWNALAPTVGNCLGCVLVEETAPTTGRVQGMSGVIHELGHCAMGLDHINLEETTRSPTSISTGTCDVSSNQLCGELTSFTASVNATEVVHVSSLPRGVKSDDHINQCPASGGLREPRDNTDSSVTGEMLDRQDLACLLGNACLDPPNCCPNDPPPVPIQVQDIAWYRIADNNPVIADSTVIDKDTFSRSTVDLPTSGSSYAASANRGVAANLGFNNTQSVMYTSIARQQIYRSLSADDVNMVKMGMTGADRDADASPSDNYAMVLTRVSDCASADLSVELSNSEISNPGTPAMPGDAGVCIAARAKSFPQGVVAFHWSIIKAPSYSKLVVQLNPYYQWVFLIFTDGFESGNTSVWSAAVP